MHRMAATALLALLAACSACQLANAQSRPEDVALAYADAVRTRGLDAIPEYIHPDELARFKKMLLPVLVDSPIGEGLRTVAFGAEATPESVSALSDADFMRGFMAFTGQQMKQLGVKFGSMAVVGAVHEGEVVHLVTRNTAGAAGVQMTAMEVVSLKPYQQSWKLLLSGQLEGMAQAMKAQAQALEAPDQAADQAGQDEP